MTRLLHLVASPRGARSRSLSVAHAYLETLGAEVETLDLWMADLPPFDGAVIGARYALIEGRAVPDSAGAEWRRIEAMTAHFLGFDGWVISTPMWNFGLPYRLKHYIDCITQPGLAFRVTADGQVVGAAKGRAVLVCAGALDTRPEGGLAALDFQGRYLEAWLGFIGVRDITTIRVQPTYGPPEQVEAAVAAASAEARALGLKYRA